MSVNPAIEGNQPLSSGHCDPAAMIGPRSTVPIRARGHVVPQQQAAHMTATGCISTRVKALASRGPSTHDRIAATATSARAQQSDLEQEEKDG
jgi:hypothetical protein